MYFFFFNDTATTEIYTLSLHDALPILAAGLVAEALAGLAVFPVDLHDPLDRREDHEVREPAPGRPFHGLGRALRRAPDRWVRLLERPRPWVHVGIPVVAAGEGERALFRPGPHDKLRGLIEAVAAW